MVGAGWVAATSLDRRLLATPCTFRRPPTLPRPALDRSGTRAVPSLVALLEAREAPGGKRAVDAHMVLPQAVEAQADKVLRHRPGPVCRRRTTPPSSTLDRAEPISVRLRVHARRVADKGSQPHPRRANWTRDLPPRRANRARGLLPPRRRHETRRLGARAAAAQVTTGKNRILAATWRRRWRRGIGVPQGLVGVREMKTLPRRSGERLGVRVERTCAQNLGGMRRSRKRGELRGCGLPGSVGGLRLVTLLRPGPT